MKIRRSAAARNDLERIYRYYAELNLYAAKRIIAEIDKKFRALADSPRLGRKRPELGAGARSIVARNYVIVYHIAEVEIIILRVLDGRMDLESQLDRE
jgi:toxin ParE1/3/4